MIKREIKVGGETLTVETGGLAKQANGAVVVRYGGSVVLATAVMSDNVREGIDFLPLSVDYRERTYAAGRIPGGFFKREGRPTEKETLTARLIDRPLRPLFPDGFRNEVQVTTMVLSADQENDPDILAVIGASAALGISDIPLAKLVGAVRVGRIGDEFVLNPTHTQLEESVMDVIVAGTSDAVVMVEGGAKEVEESIVVDGIEFGHSAIVGIISKMEELVAEIGKEKAEVSLSLIDGELLSKIKEIALDKVKELMNMTDKKARLVCEEKLIADICERLSLDKKEVPIRSYLETIEKEEMQRKVLEEGIRADGRTLKDLRAITCETGFLPRTHGSAIFTRGETQSLAVTTLGTANDEQRLEELKGRSTKTFMLHYNFPSFSVGEVRPFRGPGRREIGHGALAEKAFSPVLPDENAFPYTIRVVSDILESNGSSSMATVCGGSLSLMDAGVPIKAPVGGVSIGLIEGKEKSALLVDIAGMEDHCGNMDLKIAGTREGITALQMDLKTSGIDKSLLREAFSLSKDARGLILDEMEKDLSQPRGEMSAYAPRILTVNVQKEKIGMVIGPAGKVIKGIIEKTGAEINVSDDGKVTAASPEVDRAKMAIKMVEEIVAEPEVGKIYSGKVKKITDFGAFVEFLPGKEGLLHISQLADHHVKRVEDEIKLDETVTIKIISTDGQGRVSLSRKAVREQ